MKLKKKIIISSYDDLKNPYYHGGGAISVHEVAKELRTSYDVTVLTSKHKDGQRSETIDGVAYMRVGMTPDLFPPLGQLLFLCLLPWYARTIQFDLWIESFTPPFSTAFLPRFTKKPVIGLVHFLSGKEMRKRYKLPFDVIEAWGLSFYTKFIVPNDVTTQAIKTHVPNAEITCIPNGVSVPAKIAESKRTKMVTFLGRIEVAQKGLDLLLEAIKRIHSDDEWTYAIAGAGVKSEETRLRALAKELGIEKKIQWLGRVDGARKHKLLEQTSIMVVTSRFETFSLSALEALAYGIPVCAFAIDGLSWLPKKGVLFAPQFDVAKLAKNIQTLQKSDAQRLRMGTINRDVAKEYEWKNVIAKYKKVIGASV